MPRELKGPEDLAKLLATATEVRLVKRGDSAKVKLRTPEGLFTLKTTPEGADAALKGNKAPVKEF